MRLASFFGFSNICKDRYPNSAHLAKADVRMPAQDSSVVSAGIEPSAHCRFRRALSPGHVFRPRSIGTSFGRNSGSGGSAIRVMTEATGPVGVIGVPLSRGGES